MGAERAAQQRAAQAAVAAAAGGGKGAGKISTAAALASAAASSNVAQYSSIFSANQIRSWPVAGQVGAGVDGAGAGAVDPNRNMLHDMLEHGKNAENYKDKDGLWKDSFMDLEHPELKRFLKLSAFTEAEKKDFWHTRRKKKNRLYAKTSRAKKKTTGGLGSKTSGGSKKGGSAAGPDVARAAFNLPAHLAGLNNGVNAVPPSYPSFATSLNASAAPSSSGFGASTASTGARTVGEAMSMFESSGTGGNRRTTRRNSDLGDLANAAAAVTGL